MEPMNVKIDSTYYKFTQPSFHIGQRLQTRYGGAAVTGLNFTTGDYQTWEYYLSYDEFDDILSEYELQMLIQEIETPSDGS